MSPLRKIADTYNSEPEVTDFFEKKSVCIKFFDVMNCEVFLGFFLFNS